MGAGCLDRRIQREKGFPCPPLLTRFLDRLSRTPFLLPRRRPWLLLQEHREQLAEQLPQEAVAAKGRLRSATTVEAAATAAARGWSAPPPLARTFPWTRRFCSVPSAPPKRTSSQTKHNLPQSADAKSRALTPALLLALTRQPRTWRSQRPFTRKRRLEMKPLSRRLCKDCAKDRQIRLPHQARRKMLAICRRGNDIPSTFEWGGGWRLNDAPWGCADFKPKVVFVQRGKASPTQTSTGKEKTAFEKRDGAPARKGALALRLE